MARAYLERAGDVAELVIAAPPLNLYDGLASLLEHGPRRATFDGR